VAPRHGGSRVLYDLGSSVARWACRVHGVAPRKRVSVGGTTSDIRRGGWIGSLRTNTRAAPAGTPRVPVERQSAPVCGPWRVARSDHRLGAPQRLPRSERDAGRGNDRARMHSRAAWSRSPCCGLADGGEGGRPAARMTGGTCGDGTHATPPRWRLSTRRLWRRDRGVIGV
jgi:hypothetical protein